MPAISTSTPSSGRRRAPWRANPRPPPPRPPATPAQPPAEGRRHARHLDVHLLISQSPLALEDEPERHALVALWHLISLVDVEYPHLGPQPPDAPHRPDPT